jgi:hypothetical protein
MDQSPSKPRDEAGGQPLPAPDHATGLPVEPGPRPLGLVARDVLLQRAAAQLVGLPHALVPSACQRWSP